MAKMTFAEITASEIASDHLLFQNGDERKAIAELALARKVASRLLNVLYFTSAAFAFFILVSGLPPSVSLSFLGVSMDKVALQPSLVVTVLGVVYIFALQFYANYFVLTLAGRKLCQKIKIGDSRFATPQQDLMAIFMPPRNIVNYGANGNIGFPYHVLRLAVKGLAVLFTTCVFLAPVMAVWKGVFVVPSDCSEFEKGVLLLIVILTSISPAMFFVYVFNKIDVVEQS